MEPCQVGSEAPGVTLLALKFCFSNTGRFCVTVCPKFEPNTPMS